MLAVYAPVAHWVWGGGFLAQTGALDFAGGTVVHVNAARRRWSRRMVVGPRKDYGASRHAAAQRALHAARRRPAVVRLVRLQRRQRAGATPIAALAFVNTLLAPAATLAVWTHLRSGPRRAGHRDRRGHRHRGRPRRRHAGGRLRRAASAMAIGALAAVPCYFALISPSTHDAGRLARRGGRARPWWRDRRDADRRVRECRVERRHKWPALAATRAGR